MRPDARPPSHRKVSKSLGSNAKRLRGTMTDAEKRLWAAVRAHRFHGFHFRRQVPIAGHVVDFVCQERRLIVEVDGATHSTDAEQARDGVRSMRLAAEGYRIVRFWNDDVYRDLPGVLDRLRHELAFLEAPTA